MDGVIEGGSNHRSPWSIAPDLPFHVAVTGKGTRLASALPGPLRPPPAAR